jgi:hypothetical protein
MRDLDCTEVMMRTTLTLDDDGLEAAGWRLSTAA